MLYFGLKSASNCEENVKTCAGEYELHSIHQGLSNKTTSYDVDWVLKVSRQSLTRKCRHVRCSAHFQNGWSCNYLIRACIVILSTASDLVAHFMCRTIVKLFKSSNINKHKFTRLKRSQHPVLIISQDLVTQLMTLSQQTQCRLKSSQWILNQLVPKCLHWCQLQLCTMQCSWL